jgi:hypothetical protein
VAVAVVVVAKQRLLAVTVESVQEVIPTINV